MTIVTQAFGEKKAASEKALLPDDAGRRPRCDPERGSTELLVEVQRNRLGHADAVTTVLVFLCALAVFCAGLFASFYLYQQYAIYRMRHFQGWCEIPIPQGMEMNPESMPIFEPLQASSEDGRRVFSEGVELDLQMEEYEKIEVPDFSHGRPARYIHDFAQNWTAIIDSDGGRCFVMPLNRSQVLPPKNLLDLMSKISKGQYNIDSEVIRESYRAVIPALSLADLRTFGSYIFRECADMMTYKLEKMTSPIYKRSIPSYGDQSTFAEFAGRNIVEMKITNLSSAPGRK